MRHEVPPDVAEHHRGDDLVGADARLHERRDERPRRTGQCCGEQNRSEPTRSKTSRRPRARRHAAASPPRNSWPSAPMLKSPARKPVREREAREDQRRRAQQRLADGPLGAEGTLPERGERLDRAVPGGEDEQRADEHGDGHRDERRDDSYDPVGPLALKREPLLHALGRGGRSGGILSDIFTPRLAGDGTSFVDVAVGLAAAGHEVAELFFGHRPARRTRRRPGPRTSRGSGRKATGSPRAPC